MSLRLQRLVLLLLVVLLVAVQSIYDAAMCPR